MKKLTEINFGKKFHTASSKLKKGYSQDLVKQTVDLSENYADFNPQAAELFISIFHSFEAGIANANSSFKWRKRCPFMKNSHLQN